jgi:uncharacterized protein
MDTAAQVLAMLRADPLRWHLLGLVRDLGLPDAWIGAGFVRNAVWDHLHGRPPSVPASDVDVIWYDATRADPTVDRKQEATLGEVHPSIAWSVKNQARMHGRNGDEPYSSATDAMRYWPETATAVAVRRLGKDDCEVAAPLELNDLWRLILRPTPRFSGEKRHIYEGRVKAKGWLKRWPLLREEAG